jgi:poly(3-hydroxyalkanoate) synthetase
MNSKHETNESERRPGAPPEVPRSTFTAEDFFDWSLEAATLVAQTYVRLFEDLMSPRSGRRSASIDPSLHWTTPNVVALELPSMRLRDFSTGTDGPATLICAPYALHGATIADFAPDHSVVETLCRGGLSRVFVTDWRSATSETRYFTIDSYLADLNVAVDQLGPPVDLIGLCQGGWLAAVYAARFAKKVRRLVLVGAPIDIAAIDSQLSRFVAGVPFSMFEEHVRLGGGLVEGERTLKAWGHSDDSNEAETVLQNPPDIDPVRRRELADRYRQWYGETVNLPGVFYLQVVKWLFKENQIAEGRFVALGQGVDLMSVRAPIFLLAAGNDEIVPAGQLFAMARLVGTPTEHLVKMAEPCGHLSLFLGAVVLDEAWRDIVRWLGHDLSEPQIDWPRSVMR